MRGRLSLVTRVGVVLTLQMAIAGCVTGGSSGVFGFIDGHGFFQGGSSGDDDSSDAGGGPTLLSSLPFGDSGDGWENDWYEDDDEESESEYSSDSDDGSDDEDSGSQGGSGPGPAIVSSPATIHNPEPASMALFGGGLAGLAALRRRKARRV